MLNDAIAHGPQLAPTIKTALARAAETDLTRERDALYDHSIREPIYPCHHVKALSAVAEEVAWAGDGTLSRALRAATNRYLHSPIKYHHALRSARQALSFVKAEG